jgi:tRNA pseudouridine38-40 synthase
MKEAAKHLVGKHDFSSFRASGCSSRTPVRHIYMLELRQEGDFLNIHVFATAFLKQMVRNLVGTLVEVGYGRLSPDDIPGILDARDRSAAGPTAPARGLTMVKVYYADDPPAPELNALIPPDELKRGIQKQSNGK